MTVGLLQTLSMVTFILSGVFLVVSIGLFILLDIKTVLNDLNIIKTKGGKTSRPPSTRKKETESGKKIGAGTTAKISTATLASQARENVSTNETLADTVDLPNDTVILDGDTSLAEDTTILVAEDTTILVNDNTTILSNGADSTTDEDFSVELDISFTDSVEIIG